jgi:hypothetical protein
MALIGDIFGVGAIGTIVDDILKMFPNAEQRAQAEAKIQDLTLAIANNQSATNTAEANTGNFFLAGWRPFVGWVAALGFTYSIGLPVYNGEALDTDTLNTILWGMLGLGAYRTADKLGGVVTTAIKKIISR